MQGKVKEIRRIAGSQKPDLKFSYDGLGNRVSKTVIPKSSVNNEDSITTYYVRDAQGNILATYERTKYKNGDEEFYLKEQYLYGSTRIGMNVSNLLLASNVNGSVEIKEYDGYFTKTVGNKRYELTNHLGNVLAVVSDKKGVDNEPDVVSVSDYYPFGMQMPGRLYSNEDYCFGFNGKEDINEINGWQDYGERMYNRLTGRFDSPDPLIIYGQKYPELSSYQFASNTPIWAIDLDGLEAFFVHGTTSSSKRWSETEEAKQAVNNLVKLTNNKFFIRGFNWKAPLYNNEKTRAKAAIQLATYVMNHRIEGEEITLIGHSHGGNVAIQAAKLIYERTGQKINIITIATPAYNKEGDVENPETQKDYINDHIAIWNKIDGVSGGLAGDDYYTNSTVTTNIELNVDVYYVNESEVGRGSGKHIIRSEDNMGAHSADIEHPEILKDKSLRKLKSVSKLKK